MRWLQHYSKYEPAIAQLRKKYEDTSKEKMLVIIDRDRIKAKVRNVVVRTLGSFSFLLRLMFTFLLLF